jgi:hypothetical protein
MADRLVSRLLAMFTLGWGLVHCAGASVDGEPFQNQGDTYTQSAGGSASSVPDTSSAGSSSMSESSSEQAPPSGCCRICVQGKACGDLCVDRELTCTVGLGCACDG